MDDARIMRGALNAMGSVMSKSYATRASGTQVASFMAIQVTGSNLKNRLVVGLPKSEVD